MAPTWRLAIKSSPEKGGSGNFSNRDAPNHRGWACLIVAQVDTREAEAEAEKDRRTGMDLPVFSYLYLYYISISNTTTQEVI